MRKLISMLLALTVIFCTPTAFAVLPDNFYGEWLDYASVYSFEGENSSTLTRADFYASSGYLDDGYIFHEDGTVDIRLNGEIIDTGKWEETDDSALFISGGMKNVITVMVTDSSGTQMLCAFIDSMMHTTAHWDKMDQVGISYKPDLYTLVPMAMNDRAWKLSSVYMEGYYEDSLGGKYDSVAADELQMDIRIMLHEDPANPKEGTVDLLTGFVPGSGVWNSDGLMINITTDSGAEFVFELQYDDSLFGTYKSAPDAEPLYVQFKETDPFYFAEDPLPVSIFDGEWHLTGVHDKHYSYYPQDELTFSQTIKITDDIVELSQDGKQGSYTVSLSADSVCGPFLDENDTGSILLFIGKNGKILPFWLMADGTLYQRNPGGTCFYYSK